MNHWGRCTRLWAGLVSLYFTMSFSAFAQMSESMAGSSKPKITYIDNGDGSMTAIVDNGTSSDSNTTDRADGVKTAARQLVAVTPGAERALELATEKGLPALSEAEFTQWLGKAGGSLEADPAALKKVLSDIANEGIELKPSDIRRLVKQSPNGVVDGQSLQQWRDGKLPQYEPPGSRGRETPDCPGLVYGAGKREICLPLGVLSFADKAKSFMPGDKPSQMPFDKPERALGEPNYRNTDVADFISLGCNGELIVEFVDNVLVDVNGVDLYIFEVGPKVEATQLAISVDGSQWLDVGVIEGARSDVDIAGKVEPGERFRYVKLTNIGNACGGRHSGADIDAIAAVGAEIRLSIDSALLFDSGQATLKPEANSALQALANQLADLGDNLSVTVEGHTDDVGGDAANQRLSEARARAVWDALSNLLKKPIKAVQIKGFGEHRPIADNATEEGRASNRRVDLLIRPQGR